MEKLQPLHLALCSTGDRPEVFSHARLAVYPLSHIPRPHSCFLNSKIQAFLQFYNWRSYLWSTVPTFVSREFRPKLNWPCKPAIMSPTLGPEDFHSDMMGGRNADKIRPRVVPSLTNELNMHALSCTVNWNQNPQPNSTVKPPGGAAIAQITELGVFRMEAWP